MATFRCIWSNNLLNVEYEFDIEDDLQSLAFHNALATLFARLDALNGAIEENKPWELYKTDPVRTTQILNAITSELLLVNQYI